MVPGGVKGYDSIAVGTRTKLRVDCVQWNNHQSFPTESKVWKVLMSQLLYTPKPCYSVQCSNKEVTNLFGCKVFLAIYRLQLQNAIICN